MWHHQHARAPFELYGVTALSLVKETFLVGGCFKAEFLFNAAQAKPQHHKRWQIFTLNEQSPETSKQ